MTTGTGSATTGTRRAHYPVVEKCLDALPHVENAVKGALFGIFKRTVQFSVQCLSAYLPGNIPLLPLRTGKPAMIQFLSPSDTRQLSPPFYSEEEAAQCRDLIPTINRLSKEKGLTQEWNLYSSKKGGHDFAIGSQKAYTANSLFLTEKTLESSKQVKDFVLAQAVCHVANDNEIKNLKFSGAVALINGLICTLLPLSYALPLVAAVEGYAAVTEKNNKRDQSAQTDADAMTLLNSSEGLQELCSIQIAANRQQRQKEHEYLIEKSKKYFKASRGCLEEVLKGVVNLFSKHAFICSISPSGNDRNDLDTPPLSQRQLVALNFRPKEKIF